MFDYLSISSFDLEYCEASKLEQGNSEDLGDVKSLSSTQAETIQPVEHSWFVTCMFQMGTQVDLKKLTESIRCVTLNKSEKSVTGILRSPSMTFTIFSSGACICYFAKDESSALLGARKVARMVQKVGYDVKFTDFKILNVSYRIQLDKSFDLQSLMPYFKHLKAMYEPEICDALIFNIEDCKVVLLKKGEIIISGAKSTDQAIYCYLQTMTILEASN
jgi:transcription initiation factor TFIID TATA-box-binding protein